MTPLQTPLQLQVAAVRMAGYTLSTNLRIMQDFTSLVINARFIPYRALQASTSGAVKAPTKAHKSPAKTIVATKPKVSTKPKAAAKPKAAPIAKPVVAAKTKVEPKAKIEPKIPSKPKAAAKPKVVAARKATLKPVVDPKPSPFAASQPKPAVGPAPTNPVPTRIVSAANSADTSKPPKKRARVPSDPPAMPGNPSNSRK